MIEAPSVGAALRVGLLAAPTEDELAAAYDELRNEALTLPWAAERLGMNVAHVEALVRSGELLAIPGSWPMRQAHRSGVGYFLPGRQFAGNRAHPELRSVFHAAAAAGWTSLDLHRFMVTALTPGKEAPARLLRAGEVERVVALIRGEDDASKPTPEPKRRRWRRCSGHRPHPLRRRFAA